MSGPITVSDTPCGSFTCACLVGTYTLHAGDETTGWSYTGVECCTGKTVTMDLIAGGEGCGSGFVEYSLAFTVGADPCATPTFFLTCCEDGVVSFPNITVSTGLESSCCINVPAALGVVVVSHQPTPSRQ